MIKRPEFQIFECENPECRFRCPNDLTLRQMEHCPICGSKFSPSGTPFRNHQGQVERSGKPHIHFEVALDNLRSTLNVGSIFRTADGAGVDQIFCCGTTPTPRHPKIEKTGLGAEDFVVWTMCRNCLDLANNKKENGFIILSLESTASSSSLFAFKRKEEEKKILLVVGNEVSGIDPAILEISDHVLAIPMFGKKTSINVAVAFGIAAYTLLK